jgi:hypothetical protein
VKASGLKKPTPVSIGKPVACARPLPTVPVPPAFAWLPSSRAVNGVRAIEKLAVRKVGLGYRAVVHVQADREMSLHDAHDLGATVTRAIHSRVPEMQSVIVHMEPYQPKAS